MEETSNFWQLGGSIAIAQFKSGVGNGPGGDKPTEAITEKQTLGLCGAIQGCSYVLGTMQR